jgi:hypothetical protein
MGGQLKTIEEHFMANNEQPLAPNLITQIREQSQKCLFGLAAMAATLAIYGCGAESSDPANSLNSHDIEVTKTVITTTTNARNVIHKNESVLDTVIVPKQQLGETALAVVEANNQPITAADVDSVEKTIINYPYNRDNQSLYDDNSLLKANYPLQVPLSQAKADTYQANISLIIKDHTSPSNSSNVDTIQIDHEKYAATITPATSKEVGNLKGCPDKLKDLSDVQIVFEDIDKRPQLGNIITSSANATKVEYIFAEEYGRFVFNKVRPVANYSGGIEAAINDDDTYGYYCSKGDPNFASDASGNSIHINTKQNPEFINGKIIPTSGKNYIHRSVSVPGEIVQSDLLVKDYTAIGWYWGGNQSPRNYSIFVADKN